MDDTRTPPDLHTQLHGKVIAADFKPYPLLRATHLQTIFPTEFRPQPKPVLRPERIELDDGDFVNIAWGGTGNGPIVVMIHGLGGGFESKYALGLMQRLNAHGWRGVILELRGAGPEPNRLARTYHHGDTADFRHICHLLREREPTTPLYGVGWSLGANILLKALGEDGDESLLTAAAAASPPFDIEPCAEVLRHGFARVYQNYLLRELKVKLRRKHGPVPLPDNADLQAALKARDFFELDDAYTAPISGFRDARDYYAKCSCGQFLHAIRRPTLIVHAQDDPFMDPAIIPEPEALAPSVTLELCRQGGHVGFIGVDHGRLHWWLEQRFDAFFAQQQECDQSSSRAGSHIASP